MAKEWRHDGMGTRAIKVVRTDAGVEVWTYATAGVPVDALVGEIQTWVIDQLRAAL